MAFALPAQSRIVGQSFQLARFDATSPVPESLFASVQSGSPLWMCDLSTAPLSRVIAGQWAWLQARSRGVLRGVYVYDASRPLPLAYMDGGSWGSPRVVGYDASAGTIDLDNFEAGATLTAGDYIAWDDGPTRRLVIALEDASADGSGNVTGLAVEPPPPSGEANLPAARGNPRR